jgi:hypothetical protein
MASTAALIALRNALVAEQERRARFRGQELAVTREAFYRKLDEAHARRIAAPGYVEPSAAKRALALQDLDRYLSGWRRRQDAAAPHNIGPFTTR